MGHLKDVEKFVGWLKNQTSAKFWIENRALTIKEVGKMWLEDLKAAEETLAAAEPANTENDTMDIDTDTDTDEDVTAITPETDIRSARIDAGLSQQAMSDLLGIPKRTIERWDAGHNRCPDWAAKLIVEKLKSLSKNS